MMDIRIFQFSLDFLRFMSFDMNYILLYFIILFEIIDHGRGHFAYENIIFLGIKILKSTYSVTQGIIIPETSDTYGVDPICLNLALI